MEWSGFVGNQFMYFNNFFLSQQFRKKKAKNFSVAAAVLAFFWGQRVFITVSIQKDIKAKFFDVWNLTSTCTTSLFGRTNFLWMQQRRDYIIQFLQRSVINAYKITRWLRRGIYEKSLFHNNPLLSHLSDAATNSKLKLSTYDLISGV